MTRVVMVTMERPDRGSSPNTEAAVSSTSSGGIEGVFPSLRRVARADTRQGGKNPSDKLAIGNITLTAQALAFGAQGTADHGRRPMRASPIP